MRCAVSVKGLDSCSVIKRRQKEIYTMVYDEWLQIVTVTRAAHFWSASSPSPRTYYLRGRNVRMDEWIYFAGLYASKFEAYCAVMWVEADERIRGTGLPAEVQVYRTNQGKFGVRFRYGQRGRSVLPRHGLTQ